MARAKITKTDDQGRKVDLHSFRYFFCKELAMRLPIVVVQRLMRHRDIRMTANLYAALGVEDLGEVIMNLPSLLATSPKDEAERQQRAA